MADDPRAALASLVRTRAAGGPTPFLVGMGGAVAVGKSTLASALATDLAPLVVCVVSIDGFLLPNAVLAERGILMRKGFPESYDAGAVEAFVAALRAGRTGRVPRYSHVVYDVVPGEGDEVAPHGVVVLEGVQILRWAHLLDLALYVDAPEETIESWYVERFRALCDEARDEPDAFMARFATLAPDALDALARNVWHDVNLVNLREHIAPTKVHADAVIAKAADHSIAALHVRAGRS